MAIKLTAQYSKKLGLPGFSSHMFQVSVETELATTDDVAGESRRLYCLLQSHVDGQIAQTGFVPPADYGMDPKAGSPPDQGSSSRRRWKCSDRQRGLICSIIHERQLDKEDVEKFANERFGKGVRIIDALFESHPPNAGVKGNPHRVDPAENRESHGKEAA